MDKSLSFKGIWIPAEILSLEDLSTTDKLLLSQIYSLGKDKGSVASNLYLSKALKITPINVSKHISKLKKLELIEEIKNENNRRILKINLRNLPQNTELDNYNNKNTLTTNVKIDLSELIKASENKISESINPITQIDNPNNLNRQPYNKVYNKLIVIEKELKDLNNKLSNLLFVNEKNSIKKNIKKSKIEKQYDPNSWEYKLSKFFFKEIEKHDAEFPQPNLNQWAKELSKLVYVDKLDVKEIEKVIMFATDDKFWSSVIIKPYSLRVKYQQLRKQMLSNQKPKRLGIENIDLSDVPMTGYLDPNRKKRTF
jgi:DNA-binding MarR family transcriptional regulator